MEGGGRQRAMAACSRDRNPSALIAYVWVECSAGEGYSGLLEMRGASAVAVVLADGGRLPVPRRAPSGDARVCPCSCCESCGRDSPIRVGSNRNQVELFFPRKRAERSFSCAQDCAHDLLELRKERKKQEFLVFKELACSCLYLERLTN